MAKRIVDEEMRFSVVINGNEAQKELFELEQSTRDLTKSNKELKAEKEKLRSQGKQDSAQYKELTAKIKEQTLSITDNKNRMKVLQDQIGITGLTMAQLKAKASQLSLQLYNMTPGSAQYNKLNTDLKEVNARMNSLRLSARGAEGSISRLANGFNKYFALGASVVATATGVALSIQKIIDYNGQLSDSQADVRKTTGLTQEQVDELTKSFGLFKTRTARIELLKLAEQAGRLGITGVKNLQDFVQEANKIKVALGDDLSEEAIQEVGKMVNIYGVGKETSKDFAGALNALGSAINEVSASGANQAGFLVDYLKRQAGIASQANISAAANIGYAATFDEIGQSVEVSATAMNKVWVDMFKNTGVYADIAGMNIKDFNNLLQTDSNEAMIMFLEGLNGNNEGLSIMVDKLEDLEAGGSRGVQALAALSSNTDLLRKRQELANTSLIEATSITKEYDVKNNNLAATIDKVKKKMLGWFASSAITSGLNSFLSGFARLIGATEDVNTAFKEQSKQSYEAAKANRRLADESSNLLDEYKELTRDGVKPTTASKERLEEITLLLRDRLGESVIAIDKETGALKLNTDAVREQIKLKRLSADEEASTLVSRLKGVQEEKKRLDEGVPALEKELAARKRMADQAREDFKNSEEYQKLSKRGRLGALSRLDAVKKEQDALYALTNLQGDISEQEKRRLDIATKLNELNYTESDVDLLFKETPSDSGEEIKEGATKLIGDDLFRYENGKWVLVKTPTPPGGDNKKADEAKKQAEELRKIQEENTLLRASLITDSFDREMALEEANHQAKLTQLRSQLATEAELKGADPKTRALLIQKNKEINTQMELEEMTHQFRLGAIIQKGVQEDLKIKQDKFEKEKIQREIAFNNEMAALGKNKVAKEALTKKFNAEEAKLQEKHLQELIAEMNALIAGGDFKGFDLDLLSEDEKQQLLDFLDQANLKLSDLINKSSGASDLEKSGLAGGVDILGFTVDQWTATFENLDTAEQKIAAAEMALGAMMNAWSTYSNFVSQKQQVELQQFERTQERKSEKLERQLATGLISQRQYNKSISEVEKETDRKRAEMEYKKAKRDKEMAVASIILNTGLAVMKTLGETGFFGIPLSAIVGAIGAVQLGIALATPLPAKGYEEGLYPVKREQDGKVFQARNGGKMKSGLVSKPTILVAEKDPEMIIDGDAWKRLHPEVKNSLYRELGRMGRMPGYESGLYNSEQKAVSGSDIQPESSYMPLFVAALNRNSDVMERLERSGLKATIAKDMDTAKSLKETIQDYDKLRNENKR